METIKSNLYAIYNKLRNKTGLKGDEDIFLIFDPIIHQIFLFILFTFSPEIKAWEVVGQTGN